ncbi:hypothetical protein JTB14_006817 [Gonioctena quinquepunctata]|nr:hypothetical protein JTB14_006817 [Gonioctena quinquepunctata]
MRAVLSHPLGPLPLALAATDGTIRKTNKAKLFSLMSKNFPPAEVIPESATYIIDEMALVQQRVEVPNTFGLLADKLLSRIVQDTYSRIDVVFHTYRSISIKNAERKQRETSEARNFSSISSSYNQMETVPNSLLKQIGAYQIFDSTVATTTIHSPFGVQDYVCDM